MITIECLFQYLNLKKYLKYESHIREIKKLVFKKERVMERVEC